MSIQGITQSGYTAFDYAKEGMKRSQQRLESAAQGIASGEVNSSRMVDLIVAERMYQANAKVIRTQDSMLGTLIDVLR